MLTEPVDLSILSAGRNWMNIGSLLALNLNGYYSKLPAGSTAAAVTIDPGAACLEAPRLVVEGRHHMAITTPTWYVRMAYEGLGPFKEPLPVRTLAVFPHDDRLILGVRAETGLRSLADIKEQRYPLRVSMPPSNPGHPAGWVVDEILAFHGISREDIESWGGAILQDRPSALDSPTAVLVDPTFDAVFDEAIMTRRWSQITTQHDIHYLPLEPDTLAYCAAMGMEPGVLEQGRLRGVEADVPTIDFSGWVLCTSADLSDDLAYMTAQALDEMKDDISDRFEGGTAGMTSRIDMNLVGRNVPAPLHPGAEAYYRERGYI
jgi:TRAP transporter TAXI family solute receptor